MRFIRARAYVSGSTKSWTFKLPVAALALFRWGHRLVMLGLVLFAIQLSLILGRTFFEGSVARERAALEERVASLKAECDSLNLGMEAYFDEEDMLYAKAGLEPMDHSVREFGTGGPVWPEDKLARFVSPLLDDLAYVDEAAGRLNNKVSLNQESYGRIGEFLVGRNAKDSRFMPSVSPTAGRYASAFGRRVHPVTGEVGKMHYGIDIAGDRWTPISATADGVVQIAKLSKSFGNYVELNHGNGYVTKYGHMQRFIVQPGQQVSRGQIIGYMGNTGRSVGTHLHYEVWKNGVAVNPLPYILPSDHAIE